MGKARVQRRGSGSRSGEDARTVLGARLRERLPEIQDAVATRVYSIADPHEVADPAYVEGLKAALVAAVEYRLAVLEAGERRAPAVPEVLLAQARMEARDGVPLDTVLRRYFAGNSYFGDFMVEEAERAEVPSATLRGLLREQATLGDRLIAAVSAEHAREATARPSSAAERRREVVQRLLAGELIDRSELEYDFDGHHLAVMAKGDGVEELLRELAARLDRRLLIVQREEGPKWAGWLGGRRPLGAEEALRALGEVTPQGVFVTLGEPGEGLAGWRFSHLQAKAALAIAERGREPVLRYADVAVVASILRDDLVADSLRRIYLEPLAQSRDNGKVARQTLRAYFEAERNVSSTAAALGVDRRTVRNRLRSIEGLLGRPLRGSLADLEIALRLDD
jgi:PucR C-terminal helix-turn-helix domain/GGDEF-like domain